MYLFCISCKLIVATIKVPTLVKSACILEIVMFIMHTDKAVWILVILIPLRESLPSWSSLLFLLLGVCLARLLLLKSFVSTFRSALDRYRFICHASKSSYLQHTCSCLWKAAIVLASLNLFLFVQLFYSFEFFASFAVYKILFCRLVCKFNLHKCLCNSDEVGT